MPSDRENLLHILQACKRVQEWTERLSKADFEKDELKKSAVAFQLLIVEEAANQLSPELQERNPQIPWRDVIGFRHVLIHQYFGIMWDRVWDTIQSEIRPLSEKVERVLEDQS